MHTVYYYWYSHVSQTSHLTIQQTVLFQKKKKSILFYITYINTKINNELWQFFFPQKEKKQWPTKWIIFDKVNCQFEIQMIYRYKKQEVNVSNSYWLNVLYYITISGHDKQYVQDQIKWSKAILQKKNRR